MPDGPFKSMTPDPSGLPRSLRHIPALMDALYGAPKPRVRCERCGSWYAAGDWPWCKGNPEDHYR